MKSVEEYRGREQTYLKHFFLEQYLERVAYNIGSFTKEFVYVDGFSGPWQSQDEALQDTSFMIVMEKLRSVQKGLAKSGRTPKVRCLFIEKDSASFRALQNAIKGVSDIQCHALNGEFEKLIPEIEKFVAQAFSLLFIDPTGWTGFGLRRVEALLRHRPGEVIVNFMFDHINRFLDKPSGELSPSFDELFGGTGWESAVRVAHRREEAIIAFYCSRMRAIGGFSYVTSTRILNPTKDRTYFYLVYATRHPKGIVEFRKVEEGAILEQERVRSNAKEAGRIEKTLQPLLFPIEEMGSAPTLFDIEKAIRLPEAEASLRNHLDQNGQISYDLALAQMQQTPLVFHKDVNAIIKRMQEGYLRIEGLKDRQRIPSTDMATDW